MAGRPRRGWKRSPKWMKPVSSESLSALSHSPFGRLPTEIRLLIYDFLVPTGTVHIWRHRNRLFNSVCNESRNETRAFGPSGTLKELISSNAFNQAQVVAETLFTHEDCSANKSNRMRDHVSLSLFFTCRQIYCEATGVLESVYARSTFYFVAAPALELFVEQTSPSHKSVLRNIHLEVDVARKYRGVHRTLNDTLNRLAVPSEESQIRLRIRFAQFDRVGPTVIGFLSSLPPAFESVIVIVPPLDLPKREYTSWYTKIVPTSSLPCLGNLVMELMQSRLAVQWLNNRHDELVPDQLFCCARHSGAKGMNSLVKYVIYFGV
ncbi:MAG: hypothetical protein Q9182_002915 [Xanthomendoza sp. 2 TL-2023]